jgi:hypothetical protein
MPRMLLTPQIDPKSAQGQQRRSQPTIRVYQASRNPTSQNKQVPPRTRIHLRRRLGRPPSLCRPPPCQASECESKPKQRWKKPRPSRRCQIRKSQKRQHKELNYQAGRVSFHENQATTEIKKHKYNYIATFGHCADPNLPDWKNAVTYVASSPASVFF